MGVTSKSVTWDRVHSLWILFTLPAGFFSWAAFIYIGIKVKQKKWILSGLIYSISFIFLMLVGTDPTTEYLFHVSENSWIMSLQFYTVLIIWIVSMIHAFLVRKEYLIKLKPIDEIRIKDDERLKRKYLQEYSKNKEKVSDKIH